MSVNTALSGDNTNLTISIIGSFDYEMVGDFRATYIDKEDLAYTIDLKQTNHLNSTALGMLLNMRNILGENTKISIHNCCPEIKKVLRMSRFDKIFELC